MRNSRVRFTIEFEANLDMIPGWGYEPEDWHQLATREFERQTHYATSAKVVSSDLIDRVRPK
jgi:hypothetical protein